MESEATNMDFKNAPARQVLVELQSDERGLDSEEAGRRMARDGPNLIPAHPVPLWKKVARHFFSPVSLVILAAGFLALGIGHAEDGAVILFLFVLNGAIGLYIERKADGALASLAQTIRVTARVRRDGRWEHLPSGELVAGDVVEVVGGDLIPADLKLLEGEIEVDQSSLTGESLPAEVRAAEMAYASGLVQRGRALGVVVFTGPRTTFGKTAQLAQMQRPQSHLDRSVLQIGQFLFVLAGLGAFIVLAVGVLRQYPVSETALLALTLLVASVPSAMPAVLAVIMATGAMTLARSHVVVRQLAALQELAGVTVICSDKTGTLTQNRLKVGEVWPWRCGAGRLLGAAHECMPAESDDLIDRTIARHAALHPGAAGWTPVRYRPPDSERKRATMLLCHGKSGACRLVVKGAPQKVLPLCRLAPAARRAVRAQIERFASRGFRTIAVAEKPVGSREAAGPHAHLRTVDERGATLLGLIPLSDEPRTDAASTIRKAKAMGVEVRMVSGDHMAAARYIASKIGLAGRALTSSMMERLSGRRRVEAIIQTQIFAEVLPAQKFEIVRALQGRGEVVAVTGDGVNDSPALKAADAGIAVSSANEVARSAADLVLLRPGLAVIVNGIEESRAIFERMQHYITYRLAETFRVLFLVPFAIIALGFFPLTPIQLVALSLLNDIPILAMATDRVDRPRAPEKWHVRRLLAVSSALGLVGLLNSGLLLFLFFFVAKLPVSIIQTLFFLKLSVSGHLMVFHARSRGPVLSSTPPSSTLLGAVVATQLVATGMALLGIFVEPIGIWPILGMWGWVVMFFFITEWAKHYAWALADRMEI